MRRQGVGPTGFWASILQEDFRKHGSRRAVTEIAKSVGVSERTLRYYLKSPNFPPLDLAYCLARYEGLTLEEAIGDLACGGDQEEDG
jgi:AcrR family transcriptional regulator